MTAFRRQFAWGASGHQDRRAPAARGFTLVELLVVISIIALLIAMLLPGLRRARIQARMVVTHADLRSISLALDCYMQDNAGKIPPVRTGCSLRAAYELPPELADGKYLPGRRVEDRTIVNMADPFTRDYYRYRAVGAAVVNEATVMEPPAGSKLYIPDGYPYILEEPGQYIREPDESPILYALWSIGPKRNALKLSDNPGRAPALKRFWMMNSSDDGMIAHLINRKTPAVVSP